MSELSHHKNNTGIFAIRVLSKETTPGHQRFLSQSQFGRQPAREEYYSWALNCNFFLMIFWFVSWKLNSCRFLLPLHFHGTREKDEESQDSQVRYTGCKPSFAPDDHGDDGRDGIDYLDENRYCHWQAAGQYETKCTLCDIERCTSSRSSTLAIGTEHWSVATTVSTAAFTRWPGWQYSVKIWL